MSDESYKLYVGKIFSLHATFEEATKEANNFIPSEPYLRIEGISGDVEGDWWAYEYNNKKWARS